MKRNILITLGVILAAGAAFAAGGYGPGQGMGYGMMGGQGANGQCPGYNGQGPAQNGNYKAITKEEAQKKVDEYMAANLKGYKIEKTQEFQGMRGTMYNFFVKDSSGNKFIIRMNPWGRIMGPMMAQY